MLVLGAGGLTVETASPDALCPPLEATREVVAARLGHVELEGTWRASYVLVHRAQGDFLALQLVDPQGVLRLERQLPIQGGSCGTLSQVIALVLERFFLRPEGAATTDEPAPELAPESRPPATPAATPSTPSAPLLAAPAGAISSAAPELDQRAHPPSAPAVDSRSPAPFRAGAGLWASNAWLAPFASLQRQLSGPLAIGVNAAFDLLDHELSVQGGSLTLRRAPLSLSAVARLTQGPAFESIATLELLGVIEHAAAHDLPEVGGGTRFVPGLGARLGGAFFNRAPAQPLAELTAAWLIRGAAPTFLVNDEAIFEEDSLVLGVSVGIRTSF